MVKITVVDSRILDDLPEIQMVGITISIITAFERYCRDATGSLQDLDARDTIPIKSSQIVNTFEKFILQSVRRAGI